MAEPPASWSSQLLEGDYIAILTSSAAGPLVQAFVTSFLAPTGHTSTAFSPQTSENSAELQQNLAVSVAAFNAFLQTNVTGPVLEGRSQVEAVFQKAAKDSGIQSLAALRKACFRSLEVDGISPYPYIPSIELFCLARAILARFPSGARCLRLYTAEEGRTGGSVPLNVQWLTLRIHAWHQKLLSQPSLGPGSAFGSSSHWTDLPASRKSSRMSLPPPSAMCCKRAAARGH